MTPPSVFISHAHADIDVTDQYADQLKLHGILKSEVAPMSSAATQENSIHQTG